MNTLYSIDPKLFQAISKEKTRQDTHIELIASENYTHPLVMQVQGSCLTNKYAEGYPKKRYYSGCEFVDQIEELAIERVNKLYGSQYANVQPHSGSQANAAVYLALLKPGDTVLGMSLDAGGHLTHGAKPSFSGKTYNAVHYGVDMKTGLVDYNEVRALAQQHRPKMIVAGFSAYSRFLDWSVFRDIADEVGAYLLVDMAHVSGLVAAGIYPNPLPFAHVVTTTTHKSLRGPRGGVILSSHDDESLYKKLNSAVFPGTQGGPLMHVIAAKALSFELALQEDFKDYQKNVVKNAQAMSDVLIQGGINIVSGGTSNHLFLADVSVRGLTGKKACDTLEKVGIIANKNSIPGEKNSPTLTSGIRAGTCAITTRGFGVSECQEVAKWMVDIICNIEDESVHKRVQKNVLDLCSRFPVSF